jgi:hypothetical protein
MAYSCAQQDYLDSDDEAFEVLVGMWTNSMCCQSFSVPLKGHILILALATILNDKALIWAWFA